MGVDHLTIILLTIGFGLNGVLFSSMAITLIAFLVSFRIMVKSGICLFQFSDIKRYLSYGSPLIFVGMAGFVLGSFDRLILAEYIGPADMAIYAVACKFALIVALLAQPFDMWWTPIRFKTLRTKDGSNKCRNTIQLGIIYIMIMAIIVTAASPVILNLIVHESYHKAVEYIPYLCGLMAVHLITNMINLGCYAGKSPKSVMVIDIISAGVAACLYFLFIPQYGAMGAIYASTIALAFRLISTFIASQIEYKIPYRLVEILFCASPPTLFIIFGAQINSLFVIIILAIISIALCLSIALITQIVHVSNTIKTRFFNVIGKCTKWHPSFK